MWNQFMCRNVENFSRSRGRVSRTHLNTLLFMMLHSRVSALTGISPAVRVQQEPSNQTGQPLAHVWQAERKERFRWWRQLDFMRKHERKKKRKESWICKTRALCFSLGRVVSLSSYFPSQSLFWRSGCQSRNAYKGNRDHLWHSCLHLTLQHHRIFSAVSWPRHSSLNNHLRLSVVTLSSIWHPFTLPLRHHHDTVSSIVLNYVIRAHLWLSTENHMEFPCALVNVTSEKGKFRDMTFTILQATVGDLLLWPMGTYCTGCDAYFCQPVISDQSNYTLINQG